MDNSRSWSDRPFHGNWPDRKNQTSAISKMEKQYWVTKKTFFRKFGKKEDVNIVASDAELDAKLDLFCSIQDSCFELQRIIDKYQEKICHFAQEENSMGRFLKENSKYDKTNAGQVMITLGKTLSQAGQQRISLRNPLLRLFQEVETFRQRAIEDTERTVQVMEKSRTEYRASLSWMKDISQELDPDTYKQLEKFRKVQENVKQSKAVFDRYKLDCLQKIDLLAAARCNMFSHALILYHRIMLQSAEKAAQAFSSIADACKENTKFQFNVVKELSEMKPESETDIQSLAQETTQTTQESDEKLLDFEETETEEQNLNEIDLLVQPLQNQVGHFLPSQLLLQGPDSFLLDDPKEDSNFKMESTKEKKVLQESQLKTSWLELFSELDPLTNPDSVGQSSSEPLRNC